MPSKQRKIAVMGYRSVGKSSLSIQFVEGQFVDSYDPTIENTFTKSTRINSQDYELKLVDTAGQDEYSIFPSQYSIDVHGYVLVYSITSTKSFDVVKSIHEKLLDITGKGHVPVVLVGNKTDLHMERMISSEEGKRLADEWKAIFLETSAKQNAVVCHNKGYTGYSGKSVSDIFHILLTEIEKADGNMSEKSNCSVC
ncbi:GTP-binding protein Rheb homolog isoform X2 [Anoplophora glabripennis]|uniref:GTP-binding protein Rheb homolog isoform X2 n=1 Tax=Anoplophora glabripennis TaxID=217634 RepID=UPI000873EB0F|nr:GTP-binding protein Rheb homolog isoform X2 [Anoplophora glabripennis]